MGYYVDELRSKFIVSSTSVQINSKFNINNDSVVVTCSSSGITIPTGATYQINGTAIAKANITGITDTDSVTFAGIYVSKSVTNATTDIITITPTIVHNSAAAKYYTAFKCDARAYTQSADNTGYVAGYMLNNYSNTLNSGTLSAYYSIINNNGIGGGSGTITNYYGYYSLLIRDSGTITNYYAIYLEENDGAGTVTNMYGIYAPDTTMKHSILGDSTFGKFACNSATPQAKAAHIADPSTLETCQTSIASILVALENIGILATS